ncbi:hypothetical protein GXM_00472 [Nostoc sphaeroides CCNUC1]|uniref:Uncharacterized protein n=1 Tax=Nostoc sphaeroides CCNUC1 TaxID=2653204 RepID=A0A5P8VSW4_9NOSO|nr:hypothetical protein GXM_00472 [Nostoc sphaeroides CCNUC1]
MISSPFPYKAREGWGIKSVCEVRRCEGAIASLSCLIAAS